VVNSIVADSPQKKSHKLESVAVISPRDVVAHRRLGRTAIEVETTAISLIIRVVGGVIC